MGGSSSNPRTGEWDERYRAGQQVFRDPAPLVVEFTRDLTPSVALDLACGPGRNALYLAERGWRVTAVDGSRIAIDLLLAHARERKLAIEARVADLESDEFQAPGESFDLVLSCYFFERPLIPLIKQTLRPGGVLILIAHVADADHLHDDQAQGTSKRAFSGELLKLFHDWRILHYREGKPGESCHRRAVAELVAQKPGVESGSRN